MSALIFKITYLKEIITIGKAIHIQHLTSFRVIKVLYILFDIKSW